MDILDAMRERHAVRSYQDKAIDPQMIDQLNQEIKQCNQQSGLHIQLVLNQKEAFQSFFVHYGKFHHVSHYIALVGKDDEILDEKVGYYGERIVLKAQQLGLNTCWVAATYSHNKVHCQMNSDERLACVITIGYGTTQGKAHRNRPIETLYEFQDNIPEWFLSGMDAVMLAPTALNQQKFFLKYNNGYVQIETHGSYSHIDLGILKYHFEVGAQKDSTIWK